MKIAIVHDWLVTFAGAERVFEQLLKIYPDAEIYSLVDFLPEDERDFLQHKTVNTSFIQKLPLAKTRYRSYLPLMPLAIEQFDLSCYDLVISSSHAIAKGVITGPDQLHISYVHTPIRYAWDLQHQYLRESGMDKGIKGFLARYLLHRIRKWDVTTGNRVDKYIANSKFISRRIYKVYRRDAEVIYPPVAIEDFQLVEQKENYYVTASRMVPYKKISLIVEAFSLMPDKKLIVIGDGPELKKVISIAENSKNIEVLGFQPFNSLKQRMSKARAFVFAAEEDFGIIPVEAQACGTPVIALGKGGALETVVDRTTGVFFEEQTVNSIKLAVEEFETLTFDSHVIRKHAEKFATDIFCRQISEFVEQEFDKFKHAR